MRSWTCARRSLPYGRAFPVFTAVFACWVAANAAAQVAPPRDSRANTAVAGTGAIRGRVVSMAVEDSVPLRNARVSVSSPAGTIDPVFTDGSGRFEFTRLAAGRYTLTAEKTGFVRTRYGSRNDLDPPMPIAVGDATTGDVEIRMPKGAAIAGRVVDELGDAVVGATVSVGFLRTTGAEARLVGVSRPESKTDDRGEYRVGGLAAGTYYVSVEGSSEGSHIPGAPSEWGRTISWGRTFYFASPSLAAATAIVLSAGEDRTGIDLVIAPSRPAMLTLSLTDESGAPVTGLINLLQTGDTPGSIIGNRGVPLSPANPRMTPSLEPGEWVAVALTKGRAIAHLALSSGDDTSLTLALRSGARIAGRVMFDGSSTPPAPARIRLGVRGIGPDAAVPAPGLSNGPATVKADGTFEITGVVGAVELQTVSPLPGWTLAAVRYGDRDLLDAPLTLSGVEEITGVQVVFADRLAELSGIATDPEGRPSPGCAVTVFPGDDGTVSGSRRTRLVRADQNGRFSVADLPSGSYLAAATREVDAAVWLTMDALNRLKTVAAPVTITGRETVTAMLRCASLP
jgi:hypothetical protein